MTAFNAIILDMDGVLIDSEPLHEKTARLALAPYGIEVPDALFQQFRGKTAIEFYRHMAETYPDRALVPEDVHAEKQRLYHDRIGELELIPGVRAFIEHVRSWCKLGLTTSGLRENQRKVFDAFDLHPLFAATIAADDITRPKPHPEPYQKTVEQLDVRPDTCLVVEDATSGVQSARGAGCTVVGLTTTFSADDLLDAGAAYTIDHFDELTERLHR